MDADSSERRLFLESVCCDYFRFLHLDAGVPAENVMIRQEVALGPGAYADIEVRASGTPPYFVEIDTGYSRTRLLESVRRKYGKPSAATDGASRVVIVADEDALHDRPAIERALQEALRPGLDLEVWDERHLLRLLGERFGVALAVLGEDDLLALRGRGPHQGCLRIRRRLPKRSAPGEPALALGLLAHSPAPRGRPIDLARDPATRPLPRCRLCDG